MPSVRRVVFAIAVSSLVGSVPPAMACGHCMEDKVAATYDHAVMTAAQRHGHAVVFAEIQGPIPPGPALEAWILRSVESCAGVIAGTSRVSLAPAALSLAYDPRRTGAGSLVRRINLRLSRRGLRAALIDTPLLAAPPSGSNRRPTSN